MHSRFISDSTPDQRTVVDPQGNSALIRSAHDRLVTSIELADRLGVKPATIQAWRTSRRYGLPFVRVGRLIRYRISAVEEWLRARTVQIVKGGE